MLLKSDIEDDKEWVRGRRRICPPLKFPAHNFVFNPTVSLTHSLFPIPEFGCCFQIPNLGCFHLL